MSDLQVAVGLWCESTFGEARDPSGYADALAVAEEAGELCRAVLKRAEAAAGCDRRGRTVDDWTAEVVIEAADVLITLLSLADREGFDLAGAARERFAFVRARSAAALQPEAEATPDGD